MAGWRCSSCGKRAGFGDWVQVVQQSLQFSICTEGLGVGRKGFERQSEEARETHETGERFGDGHGGSEQSHFPAEDVRWVAVHAVHRTAMVKFRGNDFRIGSAPRG